MLLGVKVIKIRIHILEKDIVQYVPLPTTGINYRRFLTTYPIGNARPLGITLGNHSLVTLLLF